MVGGVVLVWLAVVLVPVGGGKWPTSLRCDLSTTTRIFFDQTRKLRELGCKPMLKRIDVKSLFKEDDPLRSETLYPMIIAMDQCDNENAFCGSPGTGVEEGKCVAHQMREKRVELWYISRHINQKVNVTTTTKEHKNCMCETL